MNNADPSANGGGGDTSVDSMTEEEIIRIATGDFNMVGRMNDQADAWTRVEELARHSEEIIRTKRETHLDGHSAALSFVNRQLGLMEDGAKTAADSAASNATAMREHAAEAERLHGAIETLQEDAATMDGMDKEDKAAAFGNSDASGEDSFAEHRQNILEEMRAEMGTAEDTYRTTFSSYAGSPPEYEGLSEWKGDPPKEYPGTTPQPNAPGGYGDAGGGYGYAGGSGGSSGGGATSPPPSQNDGPQLQNSGSPGSAPPPPPPARVEHRPPAGAGAASRRLPP